MYLKKDPEDNNLAEKALHNILNEGGEELESIIGRMHKFYSNITSSNVYFYKRQKEKEALIQQEYIYTT